jgi:hypothetical protein
MKIGRNDPCYCGSGKKYKHCCYAKDREKQAEEAAAAKAAEAEAAASSGDDSSSNGKPHTHAKDRSHAVPEVKGNQSVYAPRAARGAQRGG